MILKILLFLALIYFTTISNLSAQVNVCSSNIDGYKKNSELDDFLEEDCNSGDIISLTFTNEYYKNLNLFKKLLYEDSKKQIFNDYRVKVLEKYCDFKKEIKTFEIDDVQFLICVKASEVRNTGKWLIGDVVGVVKITEGGDDGEFEKKLIEKGCDIEAFKDPHIDLSQEENDKCFNIKRVEDKKKETTVSEMSDKELLELINSSDCNVREKYNKSLSELTDEELLECL